VIYLAPELDEKSVGGVVEAAQGGTAVTITGVGERVNSGWCSALAGSRPGRACSST